MKFAAYVFTGLALACAVYAGLSQDVIDHFVDYHNRARANVSTDFSHDAPATCLLNVVWDPFLEELAQKYTDTCPIGHSSHDFRKYTDGSYIGENLAWSYGYADAVEVALEGWYEEFKDYSYSGESTGVVGHYTQMVWNETIHIGCGVKKDCRTKFGTHEHYAITCHYWPGGNIVGQKPWIKREKGEDAARCAAVSVKPVVSILSFVLVAAMAIFI